jgi:hypothetical protein
MPHIVRLIGCWERFEVEPPCTISQERRAFCEEMLSSIGGGSSPASWQD